MLHATCTQGNRVDSRLLVVGSQIWQFDHNLCFRCPNGSCKLTLDIYILRPFQWYKELPNPMGFDSCNFFLKLRESIMTLTPKVRAHLGVWRLIPSHSQVSSHNSHFGSWSPYGLPNLQKTIVEVKTHCIEDFLISLEKHLERKCLKWACITHLDITQVMSKRKVGS
jgi:hypothetical protein